MKKFLLTSAAVILGTAVAQAADIPPRPYTKAPVAVPGMNWTGFYIGGGGGYGLVAADQHRITSGVSDPFDLRTSGRGAFASVSGGFDWQFAPAWVAGVFGDAQFGKLDGAMVDRSIQSTLDTSSNQRYAAGARLGYLVAPNVLSYVNAGYSHTEYKGGAMSRSASSVISDTGFDGWFIGGGVENSLNFFGINAPGWFMKTEYRVAEYDRRSLMYNSFAGISYKPVEQTVSTQIVYRFGSLGAAPVAARPAVPLVNWTGFYLSGGGGYGLFDARTVAGNDPETYRSGGKGYFGTVGGGFDWQLTPAWVVGVFGDAQIGEIKGTMFRLSDITAGNLNNNLSYAVGARLGYVVAPNVLAYVNGGYSHADFKGMTFVDASNGAPSGLSTAAFSRSGYFLGSGVEHSLDIFGISAPGWFVKSEYRLARYNNATEPVLGGGTSTLTLKPSVQTVSTSLVYRFNWGNQVVAKY